MEEEIVPNAVRTEIQSDDFKVETKFDARAWFEQASELEIVELSQCGWGGDYPADAVAQFMDGLYEGVSKIFRYIECGPTMPCSNDRVGFECQVDEDDALRWLQEHRPSTFLTLRPPGPKSS